jgi:NAD(P)-dependent dehydrogenase (short-subunit alcohol dehydrogenase family)
MSASPTVLVTGATGATGRATVRELLQRGVKVRTLAHKPDEGSEILAASGAETIRSEHLKAKSVSEALCLRLNRLATPIGEMLIVEDGEGNLRCVDWIEHERRMLELLRLH